MVTPINIIIVCWVIFLLYWAKNWRNVKPTKNNSWSVAWVKMARFRLVLIGLIFVLIFFSKKFNLLPPCQIIWSGCRIHGPILFKSGILDYLGVAFSVIGVIIAIIARRTLSDNWSSTIDLKKGHKLITSGIYSYVRHPIYLGLLLMMIGAIFVFLSVPEVLISIVVFIFFAFRIKNEEELMTKTFPKEYPKYKKKVKALIPFMW